MKRRMFIFGLLCTTDPTGLDTVSAQAAARVGWPRPNVAPYHWANDKDGNERALKSFQDLLLPYPGLYEELRTTVLFTTGRREELRPLPRGFQITRMLYSSGQHVSNMDIRRADLESQYWVGQTRWMTVWTVTRHVDGRLLVVTYIRHDVCLNPSIILRWMQGECIEDKSLCGPECETIRRAQLVS